jgi:hypothetical protein
MICKLLKSNFQKCQVSLALPCNFAILRTFSQNPESKNSQNQGYIKTQDLSFDESDQQELDNYNKKYLKHKKYFLYEDMWKKPLERKRKRKARAKAIRDAFIPPAAQQEKIIIHNPALPIQLPTLPENKFAILNLNGTQYKVNKEFLSFKNLGDGRRHNDHQ